MDLFSQIKKVFTNIFERKQVKKKNDIQKLIELTTIIKVDDNINRQVLFGEEHYISRFHTNYGSQINLADLENSWNKKWHSLGKKWDKKRQNYRFLYDTFKLFYFSFEQLRSNKEDCIHEYHGDQNEMVHFNDLSGTNLYGMYHHGKKGVDLLIKLNLINPNCRDWKFCKKFSETRNKLIEHNHNPNGLDLQIDPSIWSLASTDSLLEIHLHTQGIERAYDAYVDYFNDYYNLERVIVEIIKQF